MQDTMRKKTDRLYLRRRHTPWRRWALTCYGLLAVPMALSSASAVVSGDQGVVSAVLSPLLWPLFLVPLIAVLAFPITIPAAIVIYKRFWAKQARRYRRVLAERDERVGSWAHAQSALAHQEHWDPVAIRSQIAATLNATPHVAQRLRSSVETATGKAPAGAAALSVWLWTADAQSQRVLAAAAIDDGTAKLPREPGRWYWAVFEFRDGGWAMVELIAGERVFDHLDDPALGPMAPEKLLAERYARGAIEIEDLDAQLGPALAKPLDTTSLEIFGR